MVTLATLRALHEHDHHLADYCTCSTWARTPYKHGAVNKADQFVSTSPGLCPRSCALHAPADARPSPIWVISKISQLAYT